MYCRVWSWPQKYLQHVRLVVSKVQWPDPPPPLPPSHNTSTDNYFWNSHVQTQVLSKVRWPQPSPPTFHNTSTDNQFWKSRAQTQVLWIEHRGVTRSHNNCISVPSHAAIPAAALVLQVKCCLCNSTSGHYSATELADMGATDCEGAATCVSDMTFGTQRSCHIWSLWSYIYTYVNIACELSAGECYKGLHSELGIRIITDQIPLICIWTTVFE